MGTLSLSRSFYLSDLERILLSESGYYSDNLLAFLIDFFKSFIICMPILLSSIFSICFLKDYYNIFIDCFAFLYS